MPDTERRLVVSEAKAREAEARAERAEIAIQKIRAGTPLDYVKTECKHDGSWTVYDGLSCMACNAERFRSERDRLRRALRAIAINAAIGSELSAIAIRRLAEEALAIPEEK